MERDLVAHGIATGQIAFVPEEIREIIERDCIAKGMNYVYMYTKGAKPTREQILEWAELMAKNEVYFTYTYEYGRGDLRGKVEDPCGYDKETMRLMKQVAGKYFLGHVLLELGSEFGCAGRHYWPNSNDVEHISDAVDALKSTVKEYADAASMDGEVPVTCIEATGLLSYVGQGGLSFPTLEMLCGNSDIMIPMVRGTARATDAPLWCTYVADCWYGGVRNMDALKQYRLRMAYDFAYMSGSNLFVLESGDLGERAHMCNNIPDEHTYPAQLQFWQNRPAIDGVAIGYDHPIAQMHRDTLEDFAKFIKEDFRPAGGPKVKVAFVQGNLDGFSPWRSGSSLWNCYNKKEFGYGAPEFIWRMFDEITRKRSWCDVENFGDMDLSGAPAYGTYDIINAASSYETFAKYDYLIFTGWNTMTEENYENLKKYVRGGGRLFMTAAHLNTTDKRDGTLNLIHDGDVSDLFGCVLDAENIIDTNSGYKFLDSIVPELLYPSDMFFDPLFSEGYVKYAGVKLNGAEGTGRLSDRFQEADVDAMPVWLAENKLGDGYAVLMTSLDYPSASGYSAYKAVVREMLTASHRNAHIKVCGGDKLRFTVYEGDKVYLLNTDFDCQTHAIIDYGNEKRSFMLQPRELKCVER